MSVRSFLVIGSGGREHALARALSRSGSIVHVIPGSDGIRQDSSIRGECASISLDDHAALADFAIKRDVALTVVGPEAPLCAGLADYFRSQSLPLFGPGSQAARLEASKRFAKEIMDAASVPTARWASFDRLNEALDHVERAPHPIVLKADGLAGGKGVVISDSVEQSARTLRAFMEEERFGLASASVVIEECLVGEELSFMVMVHGERVIRFATSRDHKRLEDHDSGPNTGGMGAITPSPRASDALEASLLDTIIEPTLAELRARGIDYTGFLYAGIMLTEDGPRVLEFNVRMGDPETQALMAATEQDLADTLLALCGLSEEEPLASMGAPHAACCVVLASEGYPTRVRTGDRIEGIGDAASLDGVEIYHAGTRARGEGIFETAGGRVLSVVARADSPESA
ncbi:unnamed protein product, partial [Laminaria digitata]